MKKFFLSGLGAAFLFLTGCNTGSTQDIPPVTPFNVKAFMGEWYEIARITHYFEKDIYQAKAQYTLREDGNFDIINSGIKAGKTVSAKAIGKIKESPDEGWFRVSFFRPFWSDYKVIAIADDYSSALVVGATTEYVWILSRTPLLQPETLELYKNILKTRDFPIEKLEFPQQIPQDTIQ